MHLTEKLVSGLGYPNTDTNGGVSCAKGTQKTRLLTNYLISITKGVHIAHLQEFRTGICDLCRIV